jgi:hypothetical protein
MNIVNIQSYRVRKFKDSEAAFPFRSRRKQKFQVMGYKYNQNALQIQFSMTSSLGLGCLWFNYIKHRAHKHTNTYMEVKLM